MTTGLIRGSIFCAALTAAGAAAAQNGLPPEDQSTIIVTGKRAAEKDMKDFVRALTPVPPGGQLSRFEQVICPVAIGLPPLQGKAVANRLRRVAQEVGIAVGGANCAPNVVVAVTQDKTVFLQELRRKHAHYFGQLSQRKIRELVRQPGPAVAWQLQGPPVSARGTEINYEPGAEMYVNRTTEAASRINAGARPQFGGAVVVVERGTLDGLTATQLADYAAMRAFTGADPARLGGSAAPTILRVLQAPMGSAVPITLTQWDLGFLRGLYSAPPNLRAGAQRSAITQSVAQEVQGPPVK